MSVQSGWSRFTWGQAYWNRDALLATGWGAKAWNDGEWGNLADETVSLTGVSATSNIGAVGILANALVEPTGVSSTSSTGSINFGDDNLLTTGYIYIGLNSPGLIFEGSSSNSFETTVRAADPTQDQLILFPNEAGTLITTGSTDAVTESMMADDAIGSAQMKNLSTLILYNSAGTPVKTIHGAGA